MLYKVPYWTKLVYELQYEWWRNNKSQYLYTTEKMYNSSLLKKKTHVSRVKWKNGKTDMLSPNLKSNNSSWSYLYQGRYSLTGILLIPRSVQSYRSWGKNYWMNAYYSDIEYQEYQVYLFAKDHYDVSWNKKVVERLYLGKMYPRGWVHGRSIARHHRKPPRRPTRMMIKTARQIMIMIFFCK